MFCDLDLGFACLCSKWWVGFVLFIIGMLGLSVGVLLDFALSY